MMKKEEVDYIMDIMFDNLVNFIQSELQTIPPDYETLCSLDHMSPGLALWLKKDFIGELIIDTILNL